MQCPRCQHENPTSQKYCGECGTPLSRSNEAGSYVDLERAQREALEQQTATSEILQVISRSPTDVQPVYDSIVKRAVRLCGGLFSTVILADSNMIRLGASYGFEGAARETIEQAFPAGLEGDLPSAWVIRERSVLHLPDTEDSPYARWARQAGFRSYVSLPMLKGNSAIGAIAVARTERGPFSDQHIELLKTFADQAVIAIENVRLFKELESRNHDLTATTEILRVIASSPTELQPVFDTIAERSMRLCEATFGWVLTLDGELLHLRSLANTNPEGADALREVFPMAPSRASAAGRAILTGNVVHIPDIWEDPEYEFKATARAKGFRSSLAVPLLHRGRPIGAIAVSRPNPGVYSEAAIEQLKTFADQAVIAIENVRLFKELEARNHDLTEALEQQTATSEILRAISQSPTDVQPVFDTIVKSAVRLCDSLFSGLFRFDGERLHPVAQQNYSPEALEILRRTFPMRPSRGLPVGRAILDCAVAHVPDVERDPEYRHLDFARAVGWRSALAVPLLREGSPIGAIFVARAEAGSFSDGQVALLQTFADQAVIAIENVRLFKELEARNRDLTATSEILRVIASSPTDVRPVFDTIIRNATRLCEAFNGTVFRFDGSLIHVAAHHNLTPDAVDVVAQVFPTSPGTGTVTGRAILARSVIHVPDVASDPDHTYPGLLETGFRAVLSMPMLRDGTPIGAITVTRREPRAFSDDQLALLQTFADQAVIAVENVRLFTELEARTRDLTRSVGELRALGEIGQAISSTLDLRTVLSTIVARATQLSGTDAGVIYEYDEPREVFVPRATEHLEAEIVETMLATPVRRGEGATGRLAEIQEPIQVPDILAAPAESRVRGALVRAGYRALLAVPLVREGHLLGGLTVIRKSTGAFPPEVVDVLKTFATQSALAIQNARLFHEIADKSRQLETASQHKSEFLANMSHELRTPLNAILGFSEVLAQGMFGHVNEKQSEYLHDILESGRHLLSLINDILDLSKIEAGRMDLELSEFDLPQAIQNALTLVRERALRRGIALHHAIDDRVAAIRSDERKVKQVLLNLLSNAIKFTPEGGRIEVRAASTDGIVEVSVTDTGVGIAPEDQDAVFEEFRQVGTADKKAEGTGLGLALSRKFIELHGGRIWVTSQVGVGSTFTFTLPSARGSSEVRDAGTDR